MKTATRTLEVCLAACLMNVGTVVAQTSPAFSLADIHPSPKMAAIRLPDINSHMRGGAMAGGRYELHRATLVDLIAMAWKLETDKVIGGPAWLDRDEFEVIAKEAGDATSDSRRLMLQALLEDRFKLVVHRDTRPFPQYVLTTGTRLQLKAATGGQSGCQQNPSEAGVVCHNITMAQLASQLNRLSRCCQATTVADHTGLEGAWDFTLASTDASQIRDALEKQLGLKLEVQMVPMPVVVVDSVNEKPTNNLPGVAEQLPPVPSRFEVADIKPSAPDSTQKGFRVAPGGRLDARGFSLKELIKLAWEIQDTDVIDNDDMLVGAPKWLGDGRFDIIAQASAAGGSMDFNSARLMLRALLADRFRLETHTEEQPVSVYAMVAVRPKLKRGDPSSRPGCRNAPAPGSMPVFSLHCQNTTMAMLAEALPAFGALYVNHPVVDATGLEGGWDFDVSWSPPHLVRSGEATPAAPADPNGALTIVEALDKQLGLKLEPRKHPMPVLVIDHVEQKPTDN